MNSAYKCCATLAAQLDMAARNFRIDGGVLVDRPAMASKHTKGFRTDDDENDCANGQRGAIREIFLKRDWALHV